ncbi:MAG: efflux RND transporter periplasmic adaptor subunit [Acidobacteria bacterium]|nr:efflux RND transporter periplasmic adaptor subunit [Acidobacteriota bacterium]
MIRRNMKVLWKQSWKSILMTVMAASLLMAAACGGSRAGKGKGETHHEETKQAVHLSEKELKEFGITVAAVGPASLDVMAKLPGEITLNQDRVAHVVPRVSGIVREVRKRLGDIVRKGEIMAVIESRDLADAKSAFLAARERLTLAEAAFERESRLHKKRITSEQEFLNARRDLAEGRISVRAAEQKLHALGFSERELNKLSAEADVDYTLYEIRAPFKGTVIQKHVAIGEAMDAHAELFVVADLSTVWVDLTVYPKDLPLIRVGQEVTIHDGPGFPPVAGKISYIGSLVGESTRTALARVILANPKGVLRPGMFVSASVKMSRRQVNVTVPLTAVQNIDGENCVFVQKGDELVKTPVKLGARGGDLVEVISGLSAGTLCAVSGTFTLKAQLAKDSFGEGHGH